MELATYGKALGAMSATILGDLLRHLIEDLGTLLVLDEYGLDRFSHIVTEALPGRGKCRPCACTPLVIISVSVIGRHRGQHFLSRAGDDNCIKCVVSVIIPILCGTKVDTVVLIIIDQITLKYHLVTAQLRCLVVRQNVRRHRVKGEDSIVLPWLIK